MAKSRDWKFIVNLGDASPLDHGGYFIYQRLGSSEKSTKAWSPRDMEDRAELLVVDDAEADDTTYTIYEILLERLKLVDGYLVGERYKPDWPHPVEKYDEWFHKDLGSVASSVGATKTELEESFTSVDPLERAHAYRAIGDYFGWDNLDSYPLTELKRDEVEKRYREELA